MRHPRRFPEGPPITRRSHEPWEKPLTELCSQCYNVHLYRFLQVTVMGADPHGRRPDTGVGEALRGNSF